MPVNEMEGICYLQPRDMSQRLSIAKDFAKRFSFTLPLAVDTMSNQANDCYAAWPERLYIIDKDGRIAYKGGIGPFGYHPDEVRLWLKNYCESH